MRCNGPPHHEVRVEFSTLTRYFRAVEAELRREPDALDTLEGELNFCLRGCYASVGSFKHAYRRTEAHLFRAETADAVIRAATGTPPTPRARRRRRRCSRSPAASPSPSRRRRPIIPPRSRF